MTDPQHPLFLFGPGYSAKVLAELWEGLVFGTARSPEKVDALKKTGIEPVLLDDTDAMRRASSGSHLVVSAPPQDSGCPAFAALEPHVGDLASVTYLSTTGVYGDRRGGWVMEWTEPAPDNDRSERRVSAEQAWLGARPDARIVRLPGIYGPGRSALERVRDGTARRIVKTGQVFSRVHVDDIAGGLKALILAGSQGVFNLCDDEAAPPQDVIEYAAKLLSMPVPPDTPFDDADLSPMARSFYSECKRVSNARLKAATGWSPKYPTYREGLTAIRDAYAITD